MAKILILTLWFMNPNSGLAHDSGPFATKADCQKEVITEGLRDFSGVPAFVSMNFDFHSLPPAKCEQRKVVVKYEPEYQELVQ